MHNARDISNGLWYKTLMTKPVLTYIPEDVITY